MKTLLLAAALLCACSSNAQPVKSADAPAAKPAAVPVKQGARFIDDLVAGKKITLVTMGTSLTGGTWRWPDVMMGQWLSKEFPGQIRFVNAGVGASASSVGPGNNPALSGLGMLPGVIANKPDVVFIEFETNDAYKPYKISVADSRKNLNTIIDAILKANPQTEVILLSMNSTKDNPKAGPGNDHHTNRSDLEKYIQAYRDTAKTRHLLMVDNYPNWKKIMLEDPERFDKLVGDRIHPRMQGYIEVMLPELKKTLDPQGKAQTDKSKPPATPAK